MKILFVTYYTDQTASCRYRSFQPARALSQAGIQTEVKLIYALRTRDIDTADVVIFQRIPQAAWYFHQFHLPAGLILRRIEKLFDYACRHKPTGIDLDDRIFLPAGSIKTGVPGDFLPSLLKKSRFAIASTAELVVELRAFQPTATVIRNALDFGIYDRLQASGYANSIIRTIESWKRQRYFVFGWVCGKDHREDFEPFGLIIQAMPHDLRSRIKLLLIGGGAREANRFSNFVSSTKSIAWQELPAILSRLDGNLAILKDSSLNRCKSELKLIEAGYFGIPTVASHIGVYAELIKDGETGLTASGPEEWIEKIRLLIEHPTLKQKIGGQARQLVIRDYDLKKRVVEYSELFEKYT